MSEKKLSALFEALADTLLDTLTNGVKDDNGEKAPAPAAFLSVARQFLKDNNIEATRDNEKLNKLGSITSKLPFSDTDEHGLPN